MGKKRKEKNDIKMFSIQVKEFCSPFWILPRNNGNGNGNNNQE